MHLYLPSLNHAAVHFLPSLFGVGATRESYKTETLFMPGKRKNTKRHAVNIDKTIALHHIIISQFTHDHHHHHRHYYYYIITNQ